MKFLKVIFITLLVLIIACQSDPFLPDGSRPSDSSELPCSPDLISFNKEIFPLISSSCAFSGCHDAATAEDDVILDSYKNIMKEVTPGDANDSELYKSITENGDDIMPPPPYQPFTNAQIKLIKDWINQGAPNIDCGNDCDTTNVTFTATVKPIMENQCQVCHNNNRQDGGINLEGHINIQKSALDGSLYGSINHDMSYSVMPPSGIKMDQCFIDQIRIWVEDGAPNN